MPKTYTAYGLTGSGSLKAIDGAILEDGDLCWVKTAQYPDQSYLLDEDSGLPERLPDVAEPNESAGQKRWVAQKVGPSEWTTLFGRTFTYLSATEFTVDGDQTAVYAATRRIKATLAGGVAYSEVLSASYSAPDTTVTLASAILTDPVTLIEHSLVAPTASEGAITPAMLGLAAAASEGAWEDHSADATIVGWSVLSTQAIYYKRIGRTILVAYQLVGTSNSTQISFTLPVKGVEDSLLARCGYALNNTSTEKGNAWACLSANCLSALVLPDFSGGTWTASGTKSVGGQFWYEADD